MRAPLATITTVAATTVVGLALAACSSHAPRQRASADLDPRSGTAVTGHAELTETKHGLEIVVTLAGADPGKHGIHIHQVGDCSAADAMSAADHWNPGGNLHGSPGVREHHAGDLGNITAAPDGRGQLKLVVPELTVRPGPRSVVGHAIVVHADPDDLVSQPAGNAGARIACGVIAIKLK